MDAVFIFDPISWRLKYLNQGASVLMGLSREQLEEMRTLDLLPEFSEDEFRALLEKLGQGGLPSVAIETQVQNPDKQKPTPVELSLQQIPINGGEIVGIGRDITERKCTQAEREALYQEALDAISARDEFLSVASHELKTPLTALRLQLDALAKELSDPAARRLKIALSQISRLSRLIEELLDVTRISDGNFRLELEENVDLVGVVHDVVERMKGRIERAQAEVKIDAPEKLTGHWDRERLDEVVEHLLANALKFAPRHPVEISLSGDKDTVRFEMRDHGIGIPRAAQERIFGRFERAVSRNYGGLGLGLYIVREILHAHGGRVWAEPPQGEGAKFVFELPREPAPFTDAENVRALLH